MIEKVNPAHPDKVADRIAGAIVDLAYKLEQNPKVAVEVLIGHGKCHIIVESSVDFKQHLDEIKDLITRIAGKIKMEMYIYDDRSIKISVTDYGIGSEDIEKAYRFVKSERTLQLVSSF